MMSPEATGSLRIDDLFGGVGHWVRVDRSTWGTERAFKGKLI